MFNKNINEIVKGKNLRGFRVLLGALILAATGFLIAVTISHAVGYAIFIGAWLLGLVGLILSFIGRK